MFAEFSPNDLDVLRAFFDIVGDLLDHVDEVGEADLTAVLVEDDELEC